jgi:transposase
MRWTLVADMMAAVAITRQDITAADLRSAASGTKDGPASRRMLALAFVLEKRSREEAARLCGMDRQTLRDWVHRFNADGIAGLFDRPSPGRPRRLSPDQEAMFSEWVEAGPDFEQDGIVRWRRIDLKGKIEQAFGVALHERSVGKLLRRLSFRRLSVRPQHPQSDIQAQEDFKKVFLHC